MLHPTPWPVFLLVVSAAACSACRRQAPAPEPADPVAPVPALEEPILVDLRAPEAFARGHYERSVNLQWGFGQFELRASRLFPEGSELVIVGPEEEQVARAVEIAREAGFEARGRVEDPEAEGAGVTQRVIDVDTLRQRLAAGELTVLDARTAGEYAAGHIRGALFVYPDDIGRITPALRKDRPIAVVCAAGWRSSLVTSWLGLHGFEEVYNAMGGMEAWEAAGHPIETAQDQHDWK